MTCLVTLFDLKIQVFLNTIFGIFNELLSTQNVNVARFARNVECDFFCDFQTLCCCRIKLILLQASWPISKESFHTLQTAKSHGNKIIPKYKLTLNYHSWNNVEWYFLCDFQTLWLFFIFFWDQRNPKMRFCLDSLSKK